MDAFSNYSSVLNSVNERAVASNAHLEAASNLKERGDEIVKTLGEAKAFLSAKSIGQKVGKALKQRASATAEKYANQLKSGIQNQVNQKLDSATARLNQLRGGPEEGGQELEDVNSFRGAVGDNAKAIADDAGYNLAPETSFDTEAGGIAKDVTGRNIDDLVRADSDLPDVIAKQTAKSGAELAGDEAGASILDAIPGLDVLGVIGGAIMAGISAHKIHKQKKEEEAGQKDTGVSIGATFQSGVGN